MMHSTDPATGAAVVVPTSDGVYISQHHPHTGIILSGDFNHLPERYLKTRYRLKQIVNVRTRGDVTLDKIYTTMDTLCG